jgi:hypothetical protein
MYACGLNTYNSKELVLVVEPNVILVRSIKCCVFFNAGPFMVGVLKNKKKNIMTFFTLVFTNKNYTRKN